jgi:hypothetical protein
MDLRHNRATLLVRYRQSLKAADEIPRQAPGQ